MPTIIRKNASSSQFTYWTLSHVTYRCVYCCDGKRVDYDPPRIVYIYFPPWNCYRRLNPRIKVKTYGTWIRTYGRFGKWALCHCEIRTPLFARKSKSNWLAFKCTQWNRSQRKRHTYAYTIYHSTNKSHVLLIQSNMPFIGPERQTIGVIKLANEHLHERFDLSSAIGTFFSIRFCLAVSSQAIKSCPLG